MKEVSSTLSDDENNSLSPKQGIPDGAIDQEEVDRILDQYEKKESITLQNRLDEFSRVSEEILSAELSSENMKLLHEAFNIAIDESSSSAILPDAKKLFKIHVGSIIEDTKKSLLHGSRLEKVGASLAFVGRVLEGISTFWDELIKKHKTLKVIDQCIIKPIVISFYISTVPELALIKACEFLGRTMVEKAKTGEWKKSIFTVASTMLDSTAKHFERLLGDNYQSKFIDSIPYINNLDEMQKQALKALLSSEDGVGIVKHTIKNPQTAATCVGGALIMSKMSQGRIEVKDSLKIMQEILYGDKKQEHKINIEDFCKASDMNNDIAQNIAKIFRTDTGGHFPKTPKTLSEIIEVAQNSTKIEDSAKQSLIQFLVVYAIKNEIDKTKVHQQGETKSASHVDREEKRREAPPLQKEGDRER